MFPARFLTYVLTGLVAAGLGAVYVSLLPQTTVSLLLTTAVVGAAIAVLTGLVIQMVMPVLNQGPSRFLLAKLLLGAVIGVVLGLITQQDLLLAAMVGEVGALFSLDSEVETI
jgi:tetrahydromethanopterin S-methyltransferase subunit C